LYLLGWILVVDVWVVVEEKFVSKKKTWKKFVISPKEDMGYGKIAFKSKDRWGECVKNSWELLPRKGVALGHLSPKWMWWRRSGPSSSSIFQDKMVQHMEKVGSILHKFWECGYV
jgi:hypothetical protein